MDFKTVAISVSNEVAENMEERGIKEDDIRELIAYAEESGKKLYIEGEPHYLAKKRIGNFCAYAEYEITENGVTLLDAYCHMVKFSDEE